VGVIRIITIEREYGCGAAQIAAKLATRLGWKLWDQQLTQEIARLAHCEQSAVAQREERRDPLYQRLLKSFALGSYEGLRGGQPVEMLDSDSIFKISKQVVEQAAGAGNCVMVGRGSQHFLQGRRDVLRFFLYAPTQDKVRRLVSEGHKQEHAEAMVDTVDRERAAFIKNYFHAEWPNRAVYHAMINTALGEDAVVEAILSFLKQDAPGPKRIAAEPAILTKE
jgi:cytidylate kinase